MCDKGVSNIIQMITWQKPLFRVNALATLIRKREWKHLNPT